MDFEPATGGRHDDGRRAEPGAGRRRDVDSDAPEPQRGGHAEQRIETERGGHLQHQPQFAERRRRDFRGRLHGRSGVEPRAAVHEPPLRLRPDPVPFFAGTRLSDQRLLGGLAGRGTALPRAQGDVPRAHGGRDGSHFGRPARRNERGHARRQHPPTHAGAQGGHRSRHALPGAHRAVLLR